MMTTTTMTTTMVLHVPRYGGLGSGTPFSDSHPVTTVLSYTLAFSWVVVVCAARLLTGGSSPADVQGGMLVGGVLIRIWLPICDVANDWIVDGARKTAGLSQWAVLVLGALLLMAIHPFSPKDRRSWVCIGHSTKVIAFAVFFIDGASTCTALECSNHHLEELRCASCCCGACCCCGASCRCGAPPSRRAQARHNNNKNAPYSRRIYGHNKNPSACHV